MVFLLLMHNKPFREKCTPYLINRLPIITSLRERNPEKGTQTEVRKQLDVFETPHVMFF